VNGGLESKAHHRMSNDKKEVEMKI